MEVKLLHNFREEQGPGKKSAPVVRDEDEVADSSGGSIRCRNCGLTITSRDQEIAVNGSHTHTFFNPAGIVFELGCFRSAPGCLAAGQASSEFTWFSGYVWRFGLCQNCLDHLGWYYEGQGSSFYGLITNKLLY
jgi:hypothetical protein